ncbi:MAG: rod shape-determining protein MreC [Candidatus Omnitrophota bacterium]|nr:MAG: rod shape-determining protein MreC [Candidatus Omnitrophota bacterium]
MHLPSKLNSKHVVLLALFIFLLLLPFKNLIDNIFVSFSRNLTITPTQNLQKIRQLQKKNLSLSLQIRELYYLKQENERLKKALQFYQGRKINLIGADIISFDPSGWRRIVIVDVGENRGITKDLYAVDDEGWLIGKIVDVRGDFSRLIFVDDPNFTAPVFVGTNSFGLLKGGVGNVKILYVENGEEIEAKDKVWLKIPSLTFPVYIGEVGRVSKDTNSLFWNVEVKLFSKNYPSHKIFIIQ